MIAECANEFEGGPTQEAIDAVNEVRSRAGVDKVSLSDFSGQEEFREFIREERTRELCLKYHATWSYADGENSIILTVSGC